MALIESGIDIEYFRLKTQRQNIILLSFGLILVGFAIGVLSGFFFEKYLLENYNPKDYRNYPQAYISMVTFFMGLGMLISHFVNRRMKKQIQ
jgi:pilus assembly protein TadC